MKKPDKKEPEAIHEVLQRWLKDVGLNNGWQNLKIMAAWNEIADEQTKLHVKLVGFDKQIIKAVVNSYVTYFEMVNFKKAQLLQTLQEKCEGINILDIQFTCNSEPK